MSEKKEKESDPELDFLTIYNRGTFSIEEVKEENRNVLKIKELQDYCDKCKQAFQQVALIPAKSTISSFTGHNVITRNQLPDGRDDVLFYNATLYLAAFLQILLTVDECKLRPTISDIDNFPVYTHCSFFSNALKAGYGIICGDSKLHKYYTGELLHQLYDHVLKHEMLISSDLLEAVVEVFGRTFVLYPITRDPSKRIDLPHHFADKDKDNKDGLNYYLRVVEAISHLCGTSEFSDEYLALDNDIRTYCIDYEYHHVHNKDYSRYSLSLFCSFLEAYASLAKTKHIAEIIESKILDNQYSHYITLSHFMESIKGYAIELSSNSSTVGGVTLPATPALALESILYTLTKLAEQSHNIRMEYLKHEHNLINSLFAIVLSQVPSSIKAECFDLLAALAIEPNIATYLWPQIIESKLLTEDYIQNEKGGIILDIMQVERPQHVYGETRAFIRFITRLLEKSTVETSLFSIIHRFLLEKILLPLSNWEFRYWADNWGIVAELCQAWSYAVRRPIKDIEPLFQSAVVEQRMIKALLGFVSNRNCSAEAVLCIVRLFLELLGREREFLEYSFQANRPCSASLVSQISWDEKSIFNIMGCIASHDKDLQIICIRLLRKLCLSSQDIVQIMLAKLDAQAIPVFKTIIENEYNDGDEARCYALQFLVDLGPSSFLLRHVTGFDQHDPPKSLQSSTLENGIMPLLLNKLCDRRTHTKYPDFTAIALQLILTLCESENTVKPTLNYLRSNLLGFFRQLIQIFHDENENGYAIGSFLRLLSYEANDVSEDQSTGTTISSFNSIFASSESSVLALDIISNVTEADGWFNGIFGLRSIITSYLNNRYTNQSMAKDKKQWYSIWEAVSIALIEKVFAIRSSEICDELGKCAFLILHKLFFEKIVGEPLSQSTIVVLSSTLKALSRELEDAHHTTRLSLYSIIETIMLTHPPEDQVRRLFEPYERSLIAALRIDGVSDIPIIRAAAYTAVESLIRYFSHESVMELVMCSIKSIDAQLIEVVDNPETGTFVMKAMCSFLASVVTTQGDAPVCRTMIDEGVVGLLTQSVFWNGLISYFTCSVGDEINVMMLTTCSKIIRLVASLSSSFTQSELIKMQVFNFIKKYNPGISGVLKFTGRVTVEAFEFLRDLIYLISISTTADEVRAVGLDTLLASVFARYYDPSTSVSKQLVNSNKDAQDDNEPPSKEDTERAIRATSNMEKFLIPILNDLSRTKNLFEPPLTGLESSNSLNLSVVTAVLSKLQSELNSEKGNELQNRIASSECLSLIWRHINRWCQEGVKYDLGKVRQQAASYFKSDNPEFKGQYQIDKTILKLIHTFASGR